MYRECSEEIKTRIQIGTRLKRIDIRNYIVETPDDLTVVEPQETQEAEARETTHWGV